MEQNAGENDAPLGASQAPSQPSTQMPTSSLGQDAVASTVTHSNTPIVQNTGAPVAMHSEAHLFQNTAPPTARHSNSPQNSNLYMYYGDSMPSNTQHWQRHQQTSFSHNLPQPPQAPSQAQGSAFNYPFNSENHPMRVPDYIVGRHAFIQGPSAPAFPSPQAQSSSLLPFDPNTPPSGSGSQLHAGQTMQSAGQSRNPSMGSLGDWQRSGETSQAFRGHRGYSQQQSGLASGQGGSFTGEGPNSFTGNPYVPPPQQPLESGGWATLDQSRAQQTPPVSMSAAPRQNQALEGLSASVSDLVIEPPTENLNLGVSQAVAYQGAPALLASAGEQGANMSNSWTGSNQRPQVNNSIPMYAPNQQISAWISQHAGGYMGSPYPPTAPHPYMHYTPYGSPSSHLPFGHPQMASAYQGAPDQQLPTMPDDISNPKVTSRSQTPDNAAPQRPPTPPKSPPPLDPCVPAEYAEAAKKQFELGEKRLEKIAEIKAQADELREEQTEPGAPIPGHEQMKVKTDGRTIFVRKTDLFISFHHTRKIKVSRRKDMVHAAPKTKTDELDVIPVAMYPDAFPPGTRGFFVPAVAKSPLRIKFEPRFKKARNPYMIRIYAGATNIISGKVDFGKKDTREQDYIVVPPQEYIDGFALTSRIGEQFLIPVNPNDVEEASKKKADKGTKNGNGDKNEQREDNTDVEKHTLPIVSSLRFEITPFEFEHHADFFVRANGWNDRQLMVPVHEKEPVEFPGRIQRYFDIDAKLINWTFNGRKFRNDWSVNEIGINPDPARKQNDKIDIISTKASDPHPLNQAKLADTANGSLLKHGTHHKDYRYFIKPLDQDPLRNGEPDRERVPTTAFETGGLLEQVIEPDPYPNLWNPARTTCFEVHIVSETDWQKITSTKEAEAPKFRPLDAPIRPCEADEIDIYADLTEDELKLFDEPIEKFEVRDLTGPWSQFTGVRSHLPNPYSDLPSPYKDDQ